MPKGQSIIESYPTPLIADVLFYVDCDHSLRQYASWNYDDPFWDLDRYPHHRLVAVVPNAQAGDQVFRRFYAAERENQDKYNFEHTKAGLSDQKFDAVTRSYIIRRDDYNATTPALGSAMPDIPAGKFSASSYHLADRRMQRVSERASRGQSTIGSAELDSLFVVEVRVYIDRETIVRSRYDLEVNGVLFTRYDIYFRGETYNDGTNPAVAIETAAASVTYWGPTSGGILREVEQVSDDVFIVTSQDLIPQSGLPNSPAALFGGTVIRGYETKRNYTLPPVLGDDGSGTSTNGSIPTGLIAPTGIEIMNWVDKDGGARNYVRPTYKRYRNGGSYRCEAYVHEEWVTQSELDAVTDATAGTSANMTVDHMFPEGTYYPSPYLSVNIPPTLHSMFYAQCDTASSDPVWGTNTGSSRYYPATNYTDWPDKLVADADVIPWRGGYLIRHITIFPPKL